MVEWSNGCKQLGELIGALPPTLMEAHALVLLAVGNGPVQHADGLARLRPALQRLEIDRDGHEGLFGGQPGGGVGIGEDQALARDDLQVDAGIGVIHALGTAHFMRLMPPGRGSSSASVMTHGRGTFHCL